MNERDSVRQGREEDAPVIPSGMRRPLKIAFFVLLILAVLPDFVVHHHEDFGFEDTFGFYAWLAGIACLLFVGLSRVADRLLGREEGYYGD